MAIKSMVTELNEMVLQGKAMEAFEKFYADDVVMQENNNPPTVGKDANRKREEDFFGSITEFRGANVVDVAVNEDTAFIKWHFDYTHKDWGVRKYDQIAVQKWKNGKIVNETFYYGA